MTEVPESVFRAYRGLPPGWKLEKLKFFVDVRNSNVDKAIHEDEQPVRLCNYTDVYYNDRITPDLPFMEGSATEAEIERFQLKRDQIIITKDSEEWDDIGIPALVTEDMPEVLCGYHLSVFSPGPAVNGGFFAWLCRAEPLNDQFKLAANGVTRFGLGQYPMKNAFIALPPLATQRQIARYLDEKMARIDGLIEKKRALLDRLAEKRQALITRAVTKGLNPDTPMKHSGIDWLGDIPTHWHVLPLKRLTSEPLSYGANAAAEFEEPDWPRFVRITDVDELGRLREETFRSLPPNVAEAFLLQPNDILLARSGATVGKSFIYDESWGVACYAGYLIRARIKRVHAARYFYWFLNSNPYWEWVKSTFIQSTIQNISAERYANLQIPHPLDKDEQQAIICFVEEACFNLDQQWELVTGSIEKLQEYRTATITAAVTGQLAELQ